MYQFNLSEGRLMETCECGKSMISPQGPADSLILIIGDSPDFEEVRNGAPFSGKRGDILRSELTDAGIDLRQCRVTYLSRHSVGPKEKPCNSHVGDALREMKTHKFVLLIGASTVSAFGINNPSAHVGLEVKSFLFPEGVFVMGCLNPPQNSAVGEFRLAISKFARRVKDARG